MEALTTSVLQQNSLVNKCAFMTYLILEMGQYTVLAALKISGEGRHVRNFKPFRYVDRDMVYNSLRGELGRV